jgi:hypothetical protein
MVPDHRYIYIIKEQSSKVPSGFPDPDSHHFGTLDQDLDPRWSENLYPDPQ